MPAGRADAYAIALASGTISRSDMAATPKPAADPTRHAAEFEDLKNDVVANADVGTFASR